MTNAAPRHHRRHLSSSDHLDTLSSSSSGSNASKWLHSSQQVEYSRMIRKGINGEFFSDGPTTPGTMKPGSRLTDDGFSDLGPGILDLHSLDTELLTDVQVPRLFDGNGFGYDRGRGFDDGEAGL